jgi:pyruvate/2-oxoglutarate dehydrogenase complex dihydrolipoamide dehydrogenase (E3) component/rhodanese-related sulfurtransferase
VLGGGFVGVELAENLRHIGLDVHVIQRGSSILSQFDPEMIEPIQRALAENGVHLHMHSQVAQIRERDVVLADGTELPADIVLCATGVAPDNALAVAAGLKIGSTGGLWVDDKQRTSDPSIFAAGDAVEKHGLLVGEQTLVPLANLANRHGRLIADVIAGIDTRAHDALGTIIIGAFGMSAAVTGLSERAAVAAGIPHETIHIHPGSHAGYYPGATRVDIKVLFDPQTGRILGAQTAGENGADKRIDVLATAIYAGLTIDDLMDLELAYAPQFGSAKDAINMAGYVGNNVLSGTTPTIQWHELDGALASGATLVDVRTPAEFAAGTIPGAMNIPVDDLRNRLDEVTGLDVVVTCQVGQRGHIATQILSANGVNTRNLDGGYLTWRDATSALARTR